MLVVVAQSWGMFIISDNFYTQLGECSIRTQIDSFSKINGVSF